jgi:hypothetical protein
VPGTLGREIGAFIYTSLYQKTTYAHEIGSIMVGGLRARAKARSYICFQTSRRHGSDNEFRDRN